MTDIIMDKKGYDFISSVYPPNYFTCLFPGFWKPIPNIRDKNGNLISLSNKPTKEIKEILNGLSLNNLIELSIWHNSIYNKLKLLNKSFEMKIEAINSALKIYDSFKKTGTEVTVIKINNFTLDKKDSRIDAKDIFKRKKETTSNQNIIIGYIRDSRRIVSEINKVIKKRKKYPALFENSESSDNNCKEEFILNKILNLKNNLNDLTKSLEEIEDFIKKYIYVY